MSQSLSESVNFHFIELLTQLKRKVSLLSYYIAIEAESQPLKIDLDCFTCAQLKVRLVSIWSVIFIAFQFDT